MDIAGKYGENGIIINKLVQRILSIVVVRYLISKFTMKNTGKCLFVDKVNGREVWLYIDCFKKEYMAQSKWEMRCERA
jgi:hypothetical protein